MTYIAIKIYNVSISNFIGQKFNKLTVICAVGKTGNRSILWECVCECGGKAITTSGSLKSGHTRSCGCLQKEWAKSGVHAIHGESKGGKVSTEYKAWTGMKERCLNPNGDRYNDYGGRGIKICDRWVGDNGFQNFLSDMGRKPSSKHSLDRFPNNDTGHYGPDNCRWGTDEQQSANRRSNVWIEYKGERKIMKEWAKSLGVDNRNLHRSIKNGKPFDQIVEYYEKKKKVA